MLSVERTHMGTKRTATKTKPVKVVEPEIDEVEELEVEAEEEPEPAPKATKRPAKKKGKAAKVVEEDEGDEDEVEEKPAKAAKKKSAAPNKGTAWLVEYINEQCGTAYKPADLRVLLRKMAKKGKFEREVGEDRNRYSFDGPKDDIVVEVLKSVKSGDIDKAKRESLDKLKESAAANKKKKDKGGKKTKKVKAAAEEDVEELD
jgi:hypothetical protein